MSQSIFTHSQIEMDKRVLIQSGLLHCSLVYNPRGGSERGEGYAGYCEESSVRVGIMALPSLPRSILVNRYSIHISRINYLKKRFILKR